MTEDDPPKYPDSGDAYGLKGLGRSVAWKLVAQQAVGAATDEADPALLSALFAYQQSSDRSDPFRRMVDEAAAGDLVSIVVPAYNASRYLPETLESLLAQTHQCLQIIVVDDGSTDETGAIADRYGARGVEVVHLTHNTGLAHAKNEGIRRARGKWLGFLSADDLYYPDAVATLLRALYQHLEAGLAFGDFAYFGQSDYEQDHRPVARLRPVSLEDLFAPEVTVGMCALFARSLVDGEQAPVEESRDLDGVEDAVLWQDLWRKTVFVHVPQVLGKYRRHDQQLTRRIVKTTGYGPLLARARERYERRYGPSRRVLFVYPACCLGGAERVMAQLAACFRPFGVVCEACFVQDGGGVPYFANFARTTVIDEIRGDRSSAQALADHLASGGYDLVSSSLCEEIAEAVRLAGYRGPLVEVDHGSPESCQADRLHPDALVTVSQHQARALRQYGIQTPSQVIYNGIDWRAYASLTSRPIPDSEMPSGPVVAWVGRIDQVKRPRIFLQIAAELSGRLPSAEFRMAGSVGPYTRADDVEAIAAMCRGYSRFSFVAGITPSYMPFLYALVRATGGLLVLTSLDEAFSLVTIEAMASGIPVIASCSGAAPEIIDDGTDGLLLSEPYSVVSACEAIVALLRDPARRASLAEHAQAKVAERFSLQATVQAYAKLYAGVAGWPEPHLGRE